MLLRDALDVRGAGQAHDLRILFAEAVDTAPGRSQVRNWELQEVVKDKEPQWNPDGR